MNVKNVYILAKVNVLKISVIVIRVSGDNGKMTRLKHWTTQELETERDELIHSIADETVKLLEIQKELEYRPYLTKKDMK